MRTQGPGGLLSRTAEIAADWLESLDRRPVGESATVGELRARLGGPLPQRPADPLAVVQELARAAEPGLVAIPSGRYFGFVIGGGLPAAVAADWLTTVWDQCAGRHASVDRALRFLGIGRAGLTVVPADGSARMRVDRLRRALASRWTGRWPSPAGPGGSPSTRR